MSNCEFPILALALMLALSYNHAPSDPLDIIQCAVEALVFHFNVRKHSQFGKGGYKMKAVKIALAILNVFILTFCAIGCMLSSLGKAMVSVITGSLIGLVGFCYLGTAYTSPVKTAIWIFVFLFGGIVLHAFGFSVLCVVFAPDKNGKVWVDEKGKLFTRSLDG
jgi:hypothetical protein